MTDKRKDIVVNTSPWIALSACGQVELMKKLYADVYVPRLQAKVLGLEVIGTLGVLLKAKMNGLIPAIKPHVQKILEHGIWIKDEIVDGILKESGEKS